MKKLFRRPLLSIAAIAALSSVTLAVGLMANYAWETHQINRENGRRFKIAEADLEIFLSQSSFMAEGAAQGSPCDSREAVGFVKQEFRVARNMPRQMLVDEVIRTLHSIHYLVDFQSDERIHAHRVVRDVDWKLKADVRLLKNHLLQVVISYDPLMCLRLF